MSPALQGNTALSLARRNVIICLHWHCVKPPAELLWPLPRINSQEKEPYSFSQGGTSGFGSFIPMSTGAGGAFKISHDIKSFRRSSLLRSIGSSPWWMQSWRVRWNCECFARTPWSHEGDGWSHQILSGSFCCAWDGGHRTKRSRHCSIWMCRMQTWNHRCLGWEAGAFILWPSVLSPSLWSLPVWAFGKRMDFYIDMV